MTIIKKEDILDVFHEGSCLLVSRDFQDIYAGNTIVIEGKEVRVLRVECGRNRMVLSIKAN